MPRAIANREPKTKEEFLSRILAHDFSGDLRTLSPSGARLKRVAPNRLEVELPESGLVFELWIRKPKSPEDLAHIQEVYARKLAKQSAIVREHKPQAKKGKPKAVAAKTRVRA